MTTTHAQARPPHRTPHVAPAQGAQTHVEVTALWGDAVLAVAQRSRTGTLTIGASAANDVVLAHRAIPSPRFALVTLDRGSATVHAAPGLELWLDDVVMDAPDVVLPRDSRALVRMGNLTLVVQHRLDWLRAADRDYAADKEVIVLSAVAARVEASAG